ncbi:hypothetical protein SAMN04488498_1921, partial [Mesorhizobium albiziae]
MGLNKLHKHLRVVEANAAWGLSPEQAGWPQGPAGSQVESYDQERLWQEVDQAEEQGPAGSTSRWSAQVPSEFDLPAARSADIYGGLDPLLHLDASTPHEVLDDAYSALVFPRTPFDAHLGALDPTASFYSRSGTDYGYVVGNDWIHRGQPAPDILIGALSRDGHLPSRYRPETNFDIHGQSYTAYWTPQGRQATPNNPEGAGIHLRLDQPDGQASGSGIAPQGPQVLGFTDWLTDDHIQADYAFLRNELHPDLAARARLVDPLLAGHLRTARLDSDVLSRYQRIVLDQDGNDTAEFVFLPVNDASAADPYRRGDHWSLLLIDRRARERPVAYHYDSIGGRHH